ncbi:MAG TPA: lysylphosphatidylglycerol synthase domain-containing protein, partial [Microthrixaceae bacterium]|nr:lysylphosphatidylglycerol synthase domain-containing protein [Microthrixaceae bacterium]
MGATPDWERHPADAARLVVTLTITAALTLFAWLFKDPLGKVGTDLIRLLANIPAGFTSALVGLVQLVVVTSVAVVSISLLIRRRWRLITLFAVAAGLAVVVMVALAGLLDNEIPVDLARQRAVDSWLSGSAFPSASLLAAAAAIVTASASFTTKAWHRFAWATVGAISFLRVLTATEVPVNLLLILAVGASMGSAALLIAGAPHRRVDPESLAEALTQSGLPVTEVIEMGEQRTAPTFRAHHLDGSYSHATLLGRDQRDYDMLLRFWRLLRVKGFNERRPSSSPRRAAEHEQLVLALAGGAGVTAAKPLALALTADGAAVVATTWIDGDSLGRTPVADISDDLLDEVWKQVAKLHARRIAHRWLNLDSIMVVEGHPVLVGFRWGTTGADDTILGADVAELLSALSAHVGIERAVRSAHTGLGKDALLASVPLIQPLVIAAETREKLAESNLTVGQIREAVGEILETGEVLLAPVNRVSLKGVVSLVGSGVLVFYILSLASDWRSIADALASMNLAVIPLLLVLVLVTNAGGALSLMGSVNIALAFIRTNLIMFAQGFLNRFTPANAGGMALRARYLQREGVELNVGAAAVGLGSAASGVVQVVFIIVFLIWGG